MLNRPLSPMYTDMLKRIQVTDMHIHICITNIYICAQFLMSEKHMYDLTIAIIIVPLFHR